MRHWIERVVEPRRLILAWQAPDLNSERYRWAVGEIRSQGSGARFRYFLGGPEFGELNGGRSIAQLKAAGYGGYPAFRLGSTEFDTDVMTAFRRRLPSRERTDFGDYLSHFRLRSDVSASDFALLGLTGAKLPSDGFSIVDPLEDTTGGRELFVEIAGYRHYAGKGDLEVGKPVEFLAEPTNPHDANAVAIHAAGRLIGYVNRLRARTFGAWATEGRLWGVVERLNGRPDHPRAFVFVRVRPRSERAAA